MSETEFDEACIFDPEEFYEDEDKCECEFSRFSPITDGSKALTKEKKPIKIASAPNRSAEHYSYIENVNVMCYPLGKRPQVKPPSPCRGYKSVLGFKTLCPYCNSRKNVRYWFKYIAYCLECKLQWYVVLK